MYIKELKIRNYMIHKDTLVKLSPLTVFVGQNGGGKSALFDAMLNFSMVSRGSIRQAFGPYPYSFNATLWRGMTSRVARIGYEVSMCRDSSDESFIKYEIEYTKTSASDDRIDYMIHNERLVQMPENNVIFDRGNPDAYPLSENLSLHNDRSLFSAIKQNITSGQKINNEDIAYFAQQISRFNKFRLNPDVLAAPSRLPDISSDEYSLTPRLGYQGEDLATTLYYLSEAKPDLFDAVCAKVKEIDTEFKSFEFNTVGTDRIAFAAVYSDRRQIVPAVRLSSGTLTYIGLIVLVLVSRPPVLMIEEPENGLTPQAVNSFYRAVRELAFNESADLRSQVLISSHSPFVICEAWNGEDRDFIHQVKVVDGMAKVRKFSEVIQEQGIHLSKDKDGERTVLSLKNAEEIMSGRFS